MVEASNPDIFGTIEIFLVWNMAEYLGMEWSQRSHEAFNIAKYIIDRSIPKIYLTNLYNFVGLNIFCRCI